MAPERKASQSPTGGISLDSYSRVRSECQVRETRSRPSLCWIMRSTTAFFVGVECFAKAVEQVAVLDFAAIGFMGVRPENGIGFGIEE